TLSSPFWGRRSACARPVPADAGQPATTTTMPPPPTGESRRPLAGQPPPDHAERPGPGRGDRSPAHSSKSGQETIADDGGVVDGVWAIASGPGRNGRVAQPVSVSIRCRPVAQAPSMLIW